MTVDHFLKFRPGDQSFEAKVECQVLKDGREGPCLTLSDKTTCWVEELWNDIGIDCLKKSKVEIPWVMCPLDVRIDGYGEDAEGWIIPVSPEPMPRGLPEEVKHHKEDSNDGTV